MSFPTLNDFQFEQVSAQLIKFDADDSAPTYIGLNINPDALDSDVNWIIYKFTYSGSNVTQIVKKRGIWTDRATYF
jgi:hypothetical protein